MVAVRFIAVVFTLTEDKHQRNVSLLPQFTVNITYSDESNLIS